jgi:hypothetical protein
MKRSDEENAQRKEIIARAISEASAHLEAEGYVLTPEQAHEVSERLAPVIAQLHHDEPTEALDLLVCAATLQAVGEALGIIGAPEARPDPVALGLELAELGAREVNARIVEGGYREFTEENRRQLVTAIRRRVEVLLRDGTAPDAARQNVRALAAQSVDILLGPAPARARMN